MLRSRGTKSTKEYTHPEERLKLLEVKVSHLHSLVLKLVQWTQFQDEGYHEQNEQESVQVKSETPAGRPKRKRIERSWKVPKIKQVSSLSSVANDNLSSVEAGPASSKVKQEPTPPTTRKETARKSTSGISKHNKSPHQQSDKETKIILVDAFTIKDEPEGPEDEDNWDTTCPSPSGSLSDTSFIFEVPGGLEDNTEHTKDADFSPPPSSEEDDDDSDEDIQDIKPPLKEHLKDESNPANPPNSSEEPQEPPKQRKRRKKKYRGKKLIIQPIPEGTQPPFVALPRITIKTLMEKYGIKDPRPPKFPCTVCSEVFPRRHLMEKHRKIHPKVYKRYTCSFCGKIDISRPKHVDHVNTHTKERPHLCEICGFAAGSKGTLKSHIRLVHELTEKKIQCEVCSNMFKTIVNLKTHQKLMHSAVGTLEPFPCDICGVLFKADDKLKRHKKEIHDTGRRFPCTECDKSFKRPQHLAAHLERHKSGIQRNRGLKFEYEERKKLVNTSDPQGNSNDDHDHQEDVYQKKQDGHDSHESQANTETEDPQQLELPESQETLFNHNPSSTVVTFVPITIANQELQPQL